MINLSCDGGNDDAVSWFERNATTGAISYAGSLLGVLEEAMRVIVSSDGKRLAEDWKSSKFLKKFQYR